MIFYLLRIFWIYLCSVLELRRTNGGKKKPLEDTIVYKTMVGLDDIDFNLHMNNANYLAAMERGRWVATFQTKLGSALWPKGWNPVLGGAALRYRRPLMLFQAYEIHSRFVYLDERWAYIKQKFVSKGKTCAVGLVRVAVLDKKGKSVPPVQIWEAAGEKPSAAIYGGPMPDYIKSFIEYDNGIAAEDTDAAIVAANGKQN